MAGHRPSTECRREVPYKEREVLSTGPNVRAPPRQFRNGVLTLTTPSLMPSGSKGAALVGMTGDVEFVRHMRSQASKAGARLNDHGLWRRPRGWTWSEKSGTKDDTEWELVQTSGEEGVFQELGLDTWVEPARRNLGYIVPGSSRRQK